MGFTKMASLDSFILSKGLNFLDLEKTCFFLTLKRILGILRISTKKTLNKTGLFFGSEQNKKVIFLNNIHFNLESA